MYSYTFLYIPIHSYIFLYIPIHSYTFLYIPIYSYTFLYDFIESLSAKELTQGLAMRTTGCNFHLLRQTVVGVHEVACSHILLEDTTAIFVDASNAAELCSPRSGKFDCRPAGCQAAG